MICTSLCSVCQRFRNNGLDGSINDVAASGGKQQNAEKTDQNKRRLMMLSLMMSPTSKTHVKPAVTQQVSHNDIEINNKPSMRLKRAKAGVLLTVRNGVTTSTHR
jgi:hypothetical protein